MRDLITARVAKALEVAKVDHARRPAMTVAEWLTHHRDPTGLEKSTLDDYRSFVRKDSRQCSGRSAGRVDDAAIATWVQGMADSGAAGKTIPITRVPQVGAERRSEAGRIRLTERSAPGCRAPSAPRRCPDARAVRAAAERRHGAVATARRARLSHESLSSRTGGRCATTAFMIGFGSRR